MARVREDQPLVPSILDRLIDHEPNVRRETPKTRNQVLRELKVSVRRDLENLLNTRVRALSWPDGMDELGESLVNYGIPEFTGRSISNNRAREDFRRAIEDAIRTFEPRFKRVEVKLLDNAEPLDRTLRLRIDALMHCTPAPEPVVFDTSLEPATGSYQVKAVGKE